MQGRFLGVEVGVFGVLLVCLGTGFDFDRVVCGRVVEDG